jgi:hypothetical protein
VRIRTVPGLLVLVVLALFPPRAQAGLHVGDPAYAWTKTELGTGQNHSQSSYLGKVVLLVALGYG